MDANGAIQNRMRLGILFFLNAHALGLWGVNFSQVLKAHGLESIVPYAIACNAIAAFISPLAIGTLADERIAPERILRWLCAGSAVSLFALFWAVEHHWGAVWVLVIAQVQALWSAPTFGLTTSLILSRLSSPQEQFGPIRIWATVGWMSAGWVVSFVLKADSSPLSGYAASFAWIITLFFSFTLKDSNHANPLKTGLTWRELLGLNALYLLRNPDHRVVFVSAALLNAALSVFYPYTPLHLEDLGVQSTTAAMTLGQVTEIIAMFGLAALLVNVRLKWIFLAGLGFGVARYILFIFNIKATLFTGVLIHGFCYTLYVITAQIYLEQRVPGHMRARAQALLTLMMSGFGSLFGTLGFGWWREYCRTGTYTDWPLFWSGLSVFMTGVFIFFAVSYTGKGRGAALEDADDISPQVLPKQPEP